MAKKSDLEKPTNIIREDIFTKILADFALAESAANLNVQKTNIQKIDSVYAFDPLTENNVRRTQYDSTIAYYSTHTEEYKKIYENVIVLLSEMQAKHNGTMADSTAK